MGNAEAIGGAEAAVEQVCVKAVDGTPLDGKLTLPSDARPTAVLISHGTAGSYSRRVASWLGAHMAPHGYATLALNRRDHDDQNYRTTFEFGTDDLRVAMDLLEQHGFHRVFLCGHSKGSIYLPQYVVETSDPRVVALGMLGAVDDMVTSAREVLMEGHYDANLALATQAVDEGRGDEVLTFASPLEPQIQLMARGFLSYFGPDSVARPVETIRHVKVPTLLCCCSTDALTPPVYHERIHEAGKQAGVPVDYVLLEDPEPQRHPHDGHGFIGTEAALAERMVQWLQQRVPQP